jgi:hypothetical protein
LCPQGDVQAIGHEGEEDMRFDAPFELMVDGAYPFRPPESESLKSRDSGSRQWRRRMAFTAFGQHV